MDVEQFLGDLLEELSSLDFVEKVDLETEVFIIRGRVILKQEYFLQVYYNAVTHTTAFALLKEKQRVWGIDCDNIRGWHEHPIDKPATHVKIKHQQIADIISELKKVWKNR